MHSDYHKPSDTWDKINADDAVKLLGEIDEIATHSGGRSDEPVRSRAQQRNRFILNGRDFRAASFRLRLRPVFRQHSRFRRSAKGVRFSDVRDGSPAAKAGFKAGDVMVEFDGKTIDNLYDFTYALRAHKPGDTVKVKVLRNDKPVEAEVLIDQEAIGSGGICSLD